MRRARASRGSVWALLLGLLGLLVSGGMAAYIVFYNPRAGVGQDQPSPSASPTIAASASPAVSPSASPSPSVPVVFPTKGPGTYTYAAGRGSVLGTAGTLHRFRVAVEKTVPVDADDFATEVEATLGDPRSWIAGKNVRLQRVAEGDAYDFTVYLATAGTTGTACLAGGVDVTVGGKPYTSCRVGAKVMINLSRYMQAVPKYGAPLQNYRQYAINHEVGHALGHGHELCPSKGKLAPVMQQQTLSMQGCTANSWPYLDGKRYAGPAGHL